MTVTYSIDTDRVAEYVYAFSAADHAASGDQRPAVLGRGHAAALRRLTDNAAAELIYRLSPAVTATNVFSTFHVGSTISIELDLAADVEPANLLSLIESALASSVMATAYAGANRALSDTYRRLYDSRMTQLIRLVNRPFMPGRISPTA